MMADKEKKVVETEKKPQKPEKKKGRIKEAWRGFKSEVKKIVWPSWKQVLKNTAVVLVIVAICMVMIAALDYAFSHGIMALTDLFAKH
ncbi:MAG: preprotein translocase subunit SecE [Clostridia bacterium]|nr:preprotein translocase subunit SecE [Clostridia bacterium]